METDTEVFIQMVQCNPILWDLAHNKYKNTKEKMHVWKTISEEFKMSGK